MAQTAVFDELVIRSDAHIGVQLERWSRTSWPVGVFTANWPVGVVDANWPVGVVDAKWPVGVVDAKWPGGVVTPSGQAV